MLQYVFLRYCKLGFFNFWALLLVGEGSIGLSGYQLIGLPGYRIFRAFTRFVLSFFLPFFGDRQSCAVLHYLFLSPADCSLAANLDPYSPGRKDNNCSSIISFLLVLYLYNFLAIVLGISVGCNPWPKIY